MHKTVIKLVICLKVAYIVLIFAIIAEKIATKMGNDTLNKYEDRILKLKNIFSTLYTFTMALVLFNLFRPKKGPRLVEGEEKNLLFLFGLVLCLEIIVSVIKGEVF